MLKDINMQAVQAAFRAFVVKLIFLQIPTQISLLSSGIQDIRITDEKIREHKSLTVTFFADLVEPTHANYWSLE